jgi:drug/metabolite transporter (DMT)-like permease
MELPALMQDISQSDPEVCDRADLDLDSQQNYSKWLTLLAIFAAVIFWASSYPAIRVALVAYTPTQVAFLRYLVASVSLFVYALVVQMPLPKIEDLPGIALSGLLGFTLYNILLNNGETTVSAGTASLIVSCEAGSIAILAWLFFAEKLNRWGWIGIVMGILGVGIISFRDAHFQISLGMLEIFLAMLAVSFYSVIQKQLLLKYSAIQLTTYSIWAGTLFLFLFAPKAILSIASAPIDSTLAIAYMGFFPGVIAYISWSYVLSKIPISQAGSYLALIPVAAIAIAWIWLGEIPATICLLGGAVVCLGTILVERNIVS